MQSSAPPVTTDQTVPLLACIVKEFESLVKQLWVYAQRNPDADFSTLEERARQLRSECFASALEVAAQLHRTQIKEEWLLGKACCECGRSTQYKGKQRRILQTWVGPVTLERGYFYCAGCGTGRYPLDDALGVAAREHFSDGVQQGVCLLGVQMPFEQVSHALEMLSGISVSPREAERMTEQRGLALEENLQAEGKVLLNSGLTKSKGVSSHSSSGGVLGVWAVTLDAGKVLYYAMRTGGMMSKREWCFGLSLYTTRRER